MSHAYKFIKNTAESALAGGFSLGLLFGAINTYHHFFKPQSNTKPSSKSNDPNQKPTP